MDRYLDEFEFRFNRRTSENRGLLLWRLVSSLMDTPPENLANIRGRKAVVAATHDAAVEAAEKWKTEYRKQKKREEAKRSYARKKAAKTDTDETPF